MTMYNPTPTPVETLRALLAELVWVAGRVERSATVSDQYAYLTTEKALTEKIVDHFVQTHTIAVPVNDMGVMLYPPDWP